MAIDLGKKLMDIVDLVKVSINKANNITSEVSSSQINEDVFQSLLDHCDNICDSLAFDGKKRADTATPPSTPVEQTEPDFAQIMSPSFVAHQVTNSGQNIEEHEASSPVKEEENDEELDDKKPSVLSTPEDILNGKSSQSPDKESGFIDGKSSQNDGHDVDDNTTSGTDDKDESKFNALSRYHRTSPPDPLK